MSYRGRLWPSTCLPQRGQERLGKVSESCKDERSRITSRGGRQLATLETAGRLGISLSISSLGALWRQVQAGVCSLVPELA